VRRIIAVAVVGLALGLGACGDDEEENPAGSAQSQEQEEQAAPEPEATTLSMSSPAGSKPGPKTIKYDKKAYQAQAGDVTIEYDNKSQKIPHAVVIEDQGGAEVGKTEVVTGGKTTASVNLPAGEYTMYCPVGEHRKFGMEVPLTVQ
jgi:plastocyanin